MSSNSSKAKYPLMLVLGLFSAIMIFAVMPNSVAESQTSIPLDDKTSLEKTITSMSVPKDNTLPWAYVRGSIDNPAQGYPVIIQFFNEENGDNPMHVAQVDVKGDDTYEYKFRVRDVNLETGKATNIFEGNYTVKIFKVVKLSHDDIDTI